MLLTPQVQVLTFWWQARARIAERARDDRGEVAYGGTIWVVIGVVAAIAIGGFLYAKFFQKASEIDTNTPGVQSPG